MDAEARPRDARDPIGELLRKLRGELDAHPFELVGAAAVAGAWLAWTTRPREPRTGARLVELVLSGLGAVMLRLARDHAFRRMGEVAKRWWDEELAAQKDSGNRAPPPPH